MEHNATGMEGAQVNRNGVGFATTLIVLLLSAPMAFAPCRRGMMSDLRNASRER